MYLQSIPDLSDPHNTAHHYLSQPILIKDFNNNGKNEIIVSQNEEKLYNVFEKLKIFDHGKITILSWQRDGFKKLWESKSYSGYISDYIIEDLDNDGIKELVFAVVPKAKGFISKKERSYIISRNLIN